MATNIKGKIGVAIILSASLAYTISRIAGLASDFTTISAVAAVVEVLTLALVCVECTLLATKTQSRERKQDAAALIESAKSVLFKNVAQTNAQAGGNVRVETQITQETQISDYTGVTTDVCVIVGDATTQELRRSFLSLSIVENKGNVYVVESQSREEYIELIEEFGYNVVNTIGSAQVSTSNVLVARGNDVIYPDACNIARTYDVDDTVFLELNSVYSDQKALGANTAMGFNDKREMIRESLSTRGLSTWSTGPAVVTAKSFTKGTNAQNVSGFFHELEKAGVHGMITDEIVSEEILLEQTVSEVEWRASDIAYTSKSLTHSYKKGSKLIGSLVKAWACLTALSFARRLTIATLVALYVLNPGKVLFVDKTYVFSVLFVAACVGLGSWLLEDKRGIVARIRETYFDIEAVAYMGYKPFINEEKKSTDKSIVKKLPAVSALLITSCAVLVLRVYFQYKTNIIFLTQFQKNLSLFSGYLMLVSLLVGLGMVIVHQARATQRREVSRGANVDSEPVSMINLSPGGVGCVSVTPYEIGKEIQFESSLPTTGENQKFTCVAVVRSCVEWNDSYRIGLEFVELHQEQKDILETYCSIIYPYEQAREDAVNQTDTKEKLVKINGKAEKRFLSYAASFIALGSIIFINFSTWL